jgi:hypothetical protein
MRAALLLGALAACDPMWGANVQLRDPGDRPIADASLAVACPEGSPFSSSDHMLVRSTAQGRADVNGLGDRFPVGCDVFVAKPGYRTLRIRYTDICRNGPTSCDRVFHFDLVLVPE